MKFYNLCVLQEESLECACAQLSHNLFAVQCRIALKLTNAHRKMSLVQKLTAFKPIYALSHLFGITAVILMGVWTGHYYGGFAWQSNPGKEFNWHPLLMTIGMVYLYGNGMLMYRINPGAQKMKLKLIHAAIMITIWVLVVIALKAVFDSHDLKPCSDDPNKLCPIPNMYSFHSWIGLITAMLFTMQWTLGLVMFLFPGIALKLKAMYMPFHVFFGIVIFICAVASVLLGIKEKLLFTNGKLYNYSKFEPLGIVGNCICLFVVIFAIMVVYLVANPTFKRNAKPEESNSTEMKTES